MNKQRTADEAHVEVLKLQEVYGPPTQDGGWSGEQAATYDKVWKRWRDLAAEVQAAVTEPAQEQGAARHQVEADVRKAVRHPELVVAE
ncbi:hypothetical protein OHB54_01775 [Streptomyces sp. NBC_01007]|nr:hypothetical protein OHB54_01775 [Streptomyces sp. NBC_01007]